MAGKKDDDIDFGKAFTQGTRLGPMGHGVALTSNNHLGVGERSYSLQPGMRSLKETMILHISHSDRLGTELGHDQQSFLL